MKVAYVHILPLEYYPPSVTALEVFARRSQWEVRAWSTRNERNMPDARVEGVTITRPHHPVATAGIVVRSIGHASWHLATALGLRKWNPDVVISVEPHSALAVWIYYRLLGGRARLFIHHHEYYAPEDFSAPGMRRLTATMKLEREDLFQRAEWISETNEDRLRLLSEWNPSALRKGRTIPNYPPAAWVERARRAAVIREDRLRFLYLGSASIADTYLVEFARWIASLKSGATLDIVGNNIARDVRDAITAIGAANISMNFYGWDYDTIPDKLGAYDVGLVLYRGNTSNFIYNVPNKAIEYLAGGLEVWYPVEMLSLDSFHGANPALPMRKVDFRNLAGLQPEITSTHDLSKPFPFTAERGLAPIMAAIDSKSIDE